jgi:hypothetical protein
MAEKEIDKFLTEAMGECWHERIEADIGEFMNPDIRSWSCRCDIKNTMVWPDYCRHFRNNDFSTWEGFGKLFSWSKKERWWIDFILSQRRPGVSAFCEMLDPERFAKAVYEFLKERGS